MRHTSVAILLLTGLHAGAALAQTAVIEERYITERVPEDNIDSVAVAPAENGQPALLFATAKANDVIKVYDASTGEEVIDELGGPGPWPDQYQRPNGVAVADGLLVVVERDNRRINVRSLPDYRVVDTFGSEVLRNPYGLWLEALGDDVYRIWVTDAYEMPDESVPPNDELNERIKSFRMTVERNADGEVVALRQHLERTFGETTPPGALRIVESIFGDRAHDRLLIAEEDENPETGLVI
jgi:3-phytase